MSREVIAFSKGKIYIAGEYAVVAGGLSILFPVEKYVGIRLERADDYYIYSHKYQSGFEKLDFYNQNNLYVIKTITWFNKYLAELGIKEDKFKIEIKSELDSEKNKKYGFGSSAAIIVTLLKALFIYYKLPYSSLVLYKAAVLVQIEISKNTSFGDLACISFGKKILYQRFNLDIIDQFKKLKIIEILNKRWDNLVIKEINLDLDYLLVHTGIEANSYELVERVLKFQFTDEFIKFYNNSDRLVKKLLKGKNLDLISKLNNNLKDLEKLTNVKLFTNEMFEIEKVVLENNGVIKFSGAGGGDCILCFFESQKDLENAKKDVQKLGYNIF